MRTYDPRMDEELREGEDLQGNKKEPSLSQQVSSNDSSLLYQRLCSIPTKHSRGRLGDYLANSELDAVMDLITTAVNEARKDELHLFSEAMKGQLVSREDADVFAIYGKKRLASLKEQLTDTNVGNPSEQKEKK
jgi:hypothetical protein